MKKILVANDFSPSGLEALKWSYNLSLRAKAKLYVINIVNHLPNMTFDDHIMDTSSSMLLKDLKTESERHLKKVLESQKIEEYESVVRIGSPGFEILDYARSVKPDLLVVGSHGRKGLSRILLGSTAETVARKAKCPVWIHHGQHADIKKLLVPLDGSKLSLQALNYAIDLKKHLKNSILVTISVVESVYLPSYVAHLDLSQYEKEVEDDRSKLIARQLKSVGLESQRCVLLEGNAPDEIAGYAKKCKADLIIMTSHGRTGLAHTFMGSVTSKVIRNAPCDVLVLHPHNWKFKPVI